MGRPKKDLTGQRFGYLIVLEEEKRTRAGIKWKCQCQCESKTIITVFASNLRKGHTKSCGCHNKERARETKTKHGQATKTKGRTRTHRSWEAMLERCCNPNNKAYKNYGDRGIWITDRWQGENGFKNFYKDMGDRPKGKTLDRKDNDDGYYPENCRWATPQEQAKNRKARKRKNYYWDSRSQKWIAEIKVNEKKIRLGSFDKKVNAEKAGLKAERKYHGRNRYSELRQKISKLSQCY